MDLHSRSDRTSPGMRIRVNVDPSVDPTALPRMSADDDGMGWPEERRSRPPTPCPEGGRDRDRRSKSDGSANYKARPRTSEDHHRVIVRDIEYRRIQRQDFKVATGINHVDVAIRNQISVVPRLTPHPLHRIHHLRALIKNSVAKLLGPCRIMSHHVEHRGKRQKSQHARVPLEMIVL